VNAAILLKTLPVVMNGPQLLISVFKGDAALVVDEPFLTFLGVRLVLGFPSTSVAESAQGDLGELE
jgi:hypothetical protein